jgi:hypothetical protein
MENEQPCPYCKRVHYSTYTAGRCAARHEVLGEWTSYVNGQKRKRAKTKVAAPQLYQPRLQNLKPQPALAPVTD